MPASTGADCAVWGEILGFVKLVVIKTVFFLFFYPFLVPITL